MKKPKRARKSRASAVSSGSGLKKLDNVNALVSKEFQERMMKLPHESRPVVKTLYKDIGERCNRDNEVLLGYFGKIKCFRDLQISKLELLKGLNTVTVIYL